MLRPAFIIIIILSFSSGLQSTKQGFYTIVAPGTIRSNSVFHVSITLSDFHKSYWMKILLQEGRVEEYNFGDFEVQPGTTQTIKLRAPPLIEKRGYLIVVGFSGIIKTEIAKINFEHDSFSAFIQTNKAKYSPGELIQFRVICIDSLTRPAQIAYAIYVLIYDSQDNLIKRISNVKLVKGVFKGEFQLSDLTNLGEWKIKFEVRGDVAAEKEFAVANYDLPQFYLKINTKPIVAINEKKITLEINASYFYGEPVKGNLTININNTYFATQEMSEVLNFKSQITGITTITLDLKNDLHLYLKTGNDSQISKKLYTLKMKADLIDDLTEYHASQEIEIKIYSQPFKIILEAPKVFESLEDSIRFKVLVKVTDLLDKPIEDSESSIKIITLCIRISEYRNEEFETFESQFLLENGKNSLPLDIKNRNFSYCDVYAEYFGIKSLRERISKNEDILFLETLSESPEVNKELEIQLKSKWAIGNFSYEIVSRGDIIQSKNINVPSNQTTYILSFNVTYAMVPKITIFVHFISNGIFVGQLKDVYIKRDFQNSIQIKTDNETRPGASIYVNITTDENSYIGLMAVDQRVLTDFKYDLSENLVYTKIRNYDSLSINSNPFPGIYAGLVTFSNAWTRDGSRIGSGKDSFLASGEQVHALPYRFDKPSVELPRIRKLFSESWLYKDIESSLNGNLSLLEIVPDTITSWAITGFSINPKTGLTLTKNATNLKVFQKFFISFDLPSSVKEGEIVELPIFIFNYMNQDALINMTIETDNVELEILKTPEILLNSMEAISVHISPSKSEKIIIFLKPHKSGYYNLTVKAISSIVSDAVQKTFNVKPHGIPHSVSKTLLVHLPEEESTQENEITIEIPSNAVLEMVEISVVGDIFRPLVQSLQKRARVPYGNGEENMRLIVSNLLVLKYFRALNYTNPSLLSKIKFNLELGYQNQLCFKNLDGSFGKFEQTEQKRTGEIWHTAFALWGLHQANNFIGIDSRIRERGLDYLKSKQLENGCFKSDQGIEEDAKLTAFTLIVFLMDQNSKTYYNEVISRGLQYLYEISYNQTQSFTSYTLATYVLLLGKHEKAGDCLKKLISSGAMKRDAQVTFNNPDPDDVESHLETTAVNLKHIFESQKKQRTSLIHIIRGLIDSKDDKSALTHMIALQAMIVFVEDLQLNRKSLSITFKDDQNNSGDFQVNAENSQVLQNFKLSDKSRRIDVQSRGHGFAVVNVKCKYNLMPEYRSSLVYSSNITIQRRRVSSLVDMELCVNVLRNNSENNLTMIEVNLQSGYSFIKKALDKVNSFVKESKLIQLRVDRENMLIKLDSIDSNGQCLQLTVLQKHKVLNAKPGWFIVNSSHEKDERNIQTFKIIDTI